MAFRIEDFKKTARKSSTTGVPASLYPHQMRDKKALAKVELAIRTFDGLVGRKRGELDAQVMVDFFGDHRIARGVVACLGAYYRYETQKFAQVASAEGAVRLENAGLRKPSEIRAHTYRDVNAHYHGFLTTKNRAECYAALSEPFGVTTYEWDQMMHLDAEQNQVLTRIGPVPSAKDVVALYNFHSLDTPLRRAQEIFISGLDLSSAQASDVRAFAESLVVRAHIGNEGTSVLLSDLDAASLLPRHAGRLSRCLMQITQTYGHGYLTGHVDVTLSSKKMRLSLGPETFQTLLGKYRRADETTLRQRMAQGDALHKALLKLRVQGEAAGWRIKRSPEPILTAQGALLPDFRLTSPHGLEVLLSLGEAPVGDWMRPICTLSVTDELDSSLVFAQVKELMGERQEKPAEQSVPADVLALCDRAAAQGMVRASDAQRTLHLLDESPLIEWIRRTGDTRVRYIPGVGLCSEAMVAAIAGADRGDAIAA
jgi:predicted nuclease of restriction endonuclease-like RecB superfamily